MHDGVYHTRANGLGFCGGAAVVLIHGFAGSPDGFGPPRFQNYAVSIELPKVSSVRDFEAPASAGKKKSSGKGGKI